MEVYLVPLISWICLTTKLDFARLYCVGTRTVSSAATSTTIFVKGGQSGGLADASKISSGDMIERTYSQPVSLT